jgi:hypothetical protein
MIDAQVFGIVVFAAALIIVCVGIANVIEMLVHFVRLAARGIRALRARSSRSESTVSP